MRRLLAAAVFLLCACGTDAPPYAACEEGSDCGDGSDGCYGVELTRTDGSTSEGSLCTRRCETDEDCPVDGVCLALAGDPSGETLCWATCDVALDCYVGLRCTEVDGAPGVSSICLP